MSVVEMVEIKKQVQGLLDQVVISPNSSPCGSLIVMVPKKDGTWIMCVDYRALNKITMQNRYPLHHIDDLLDQLKNVVYFTKLDLHSGYHQIRVTEHDAWKNYFKTKQGLFEWLVMSFGICNAPVTFMRVMNNVFRPLIDDFVIVYLDVIFFFSETWDKHVRHVKKVLDTLQRDKLYVKLSKCEFCKNALVYLVHIVGGGKLKIDPSKIDVIVNWPKTKSLIKVQIFLGAIQYYRIFIPNFSFIASPLHALTSVKNTFQCEGNQQKTFDTLKRKINTPLVLSLSNLQQPFEIKTDSSRYAMGAVLMQYHKHICYHSETFSHVVINYTTYDKELYALVQGIKKWKHYSLGKETIIHIDHQPLQYLQSQTKLQQSRHYKWMGFLQQFHLVIKYKKGTSNKLVDILSRPPIIASIILKNAYLSHDSYIEQYPIDEDFKEVYMKLTLGAQVENCCLQGKLLYHLGKLCIPTSE
jgi:hypothetical protein